MRKISPVKLSMALLAVVSGGVVGHCYATYTDRISEDAFVTQLIELYAAHQAVRQVMGSALPAGSDVTCYARHRMMDRHQAPYCDHQAGNLDTYGKPARTPAPGIENGYGGHSLITYADDADHFLAYATKVPAVVCAKFAKDYLRCVDTLPATKRAAPARPADFTWQEQSECRLDANNNVICKPAAPTTTGATP